MSVRKHQRYHRPEAANDVREPFRRGRARIARKQMLVDRRGFRFGELARPQRHERLVRVHPERRDIAPAARDRRAPTTEARSPPEARRRTRSRYAFGAHYRDAYPSPRCGTFLRRTRPADPPRPSRRERPARPPGVVSTMTARAHHHRTSGGRGIPVTRRLSKKTTGDSPMAVTILS
jgi:hypothetical protein